MAPRRKLGRQNISTKMKNRPPCRAFCKPCCYFLAALSVLIGLIILVIILVSVFPLPLDRIHDWIVSKFAPEDTFQSYIKLLPCSDYKITDVWTVNLPKLTTDSPIYLLDVDSDGVKDVIFGFGSGDNYDILPEDIFCSIFMGVTPPCEGGVIALNGITGSIIWRYWANSTVYFIHCSEDINKDGLEDCLIMGTHGTISLINTKNGTAIWKHHYGNHEEIFLGSFISDQNNDSIADILTSHTNLSENGGQIMVLSGKTGNVIIKIPIGAKSFYMPQTFVKNGSDYIIFGNGGPTTPGNLSVAKLKPFLFSTSEPFNNITVLYQDPLNGIMIQSVLVDITGDQVPDIITALFNSTVVAYNGQNFSQIWNFTVQNAQTNTVPIPGYFNFDNTTDFLVIYETYDNILKYNYTKTYILDGVTGKPIYKKPISDSVKNQLGGITISMESFGYDLFLFWTSECKNIDVFKKIDFPVEGINIHPLYENCHHQENTTVVLKLNMLNQFDQPPGIEIYNSLNRSILEFSSMKSPMQIIKDYFNSHPKFSSQNSGQVEESEGYDNNNAGNIGIHKYGNSNFRHKDSKQGLIRDFSSPDNYGNYQDITDRRKPFGHYYESGAPDELDDYNSDEDMNKKERNLIIKTKSISNRDPRSKFENEDSTENSSNETSEIDTLFSDAEERSKDESSSPIKGGMYDYKNVRLAKSRLFHDLSNSPDEILSDIFYKNLENRLRSSKFEQRDLSSHSNKKAEEESINRVIKEHKKLQLNNSYNLWNLESEKEEDDRKNNYWRSRRRKRHAISGSLLKMTSVGAVSESFHVGNNSNSIDVIFLTYWQPTKYEPRKSLEEELAECVEKKLSLAGDPLDFQKNTEDEKRTLYFNECVIEQRNFKRDFPYFNDVYKLNMGQMTVYRLRIECQCNLTKENERCAKFSSESGQMWPFYLGKRGKGMIIK